MGQVNSKETKVKLPPLKKGRKQKGGVIFFAFLLLFLTLPSFAKEWHTEPSPLLLKDLQNYVDSTHIGGQVGISIYSIRNQRFEAQWNDTEWFTPASCLKLIVTAAALDAFPVNYYPTTTLEVQGALRGKTLRGALNVVGGGDPNISDRFFPDAMTPLLAWADSIQSLGIDTIRGDITVSDTFFTGPRRPTAWESHHYNTWYGAEISALSYNDNTFNLSVGPGEKPGAPPVVTITPDVGYVQVFNKARTVKGGANRIGVSQHEGVTAITLTGRVGADAASRMWILPVRNPALYFRTALMKVLEQQGIVYVKEAVKSSKEKPLKTFKFTTAPLMALVEETNQRSQNLHAEHLLRHLGKRVYGKGSAEAGLRAEKKFLSGMGLDTADFDLHDGCGLSHDNRIKPQSMALLLAHMARHPYGKDYVASLAMPGLDGATGKRLRSFSDEDLIRYKTGSINGVQGLSGYIFANDGDTLAAAMWINGFRAPSETASHLMDSLFSRATLWYSKERAATATAFKLLSRPDAPPTYIDRLRYFSKALEGTPYSLGPTGEGRYANIESLPLVDLNHFDCVTFIESSVGLAVSRQASDVVPSILPIRYHSDTLTYATRNHFFVGDWLGNNRQWFRILRVPRDTLVHKILYKGKLLSAKGLTPSTPDTAVDFSYLPYDRALELAGHWTLGKRLLGIAFVTKIEGLDVTHTGFLDAESGKPMLRHAGQLKGMVVEQDFKEYLETRRGKCTGVLLFEFLPPPGQ